MKLRFVEFLVDLIVASIVTFGILYVILIWIWT